MTGRHPQDPPHASEGPHTHARQASVAQQTFSPSTYADLQAASAAMPLPPVPTERGASVQENSGQRVARDMPSLPQMSQQAATKQSLKTWWTKFTKQQQEKQSNTYAKQELSPTLGTSSGGSGPYKGVFGVPLTQSLKYAGVAISMVGPDGVNQVYGYIPIVVAKCGLFLKQKATNIEGVFRISGSTRRMKDLQDLFDRPPTYGRDIVWGPWSVHDAANVLRRYLNQMPEPVVPGEKYEDFRNALPPVDKMNDPEAVTKSVARYKELIASLPSSSKYLLCYVLDLLNVFAKNHAVTLMTASNLAVVFQPGLIRNPANDKALPFGSAVPSSGQELAAPQFQGLTRSSSNPAVQSSAAPSSDANSGSNNAELQRRQDEIRINQEVLEFLIHNQDHFVSLPEMAPPAPPFAAVTSGSGSSTEVSPISISSASKASIAGQPQTIQATVPGTPTQYLATPAQPPSSSSYPLQTSASQQSVMSNNTTGVKTARQPPEMYPNDAGTRPHTESNASQSTSASQTVYSPQQSPSLLQARDAGSAASFKEDGREKPHYRETRQPRKLKKSGKSGSGSSTPVLTAGHRHPQASPLIGQAYVYDEDIPLSAPNAKFSDLAGASTSGATVKRSRTLPGPSVSPRANSLRSVAASRRASDAAPASPPMTPIIPSTTIITTAASPEQEQEQQQQPYRGLHRSVSGSSSRFVPPPPVDIESEYSTEMSGDETGLRSRRRGAWRIAFRRDKDKKTESLAPSGLSRSYSPETSRVHPVGSQNRHIANEQDVMARPASALSVIKPSDRRPRSSSGAGTEAPSQRRPSIATSSAAGGPSGHAMGTSPSGQGLVKHRNPPPTGQSPDLSRRSVRKMAEEEAEKRVKDIQKAVANMGR